MRSSRNLQVPALDAKEPGRDLGQSVVLHGELR